MLPRALLLLALGATSALASTSKPHCVVSFRELTRDAALSERTITPKETLHFEPHQRSGIEEFGLEKIESAQDVPQGGGELLRKGKFLLSFGFASCHAILLRNHETNQIALLHYQGVLTGKQLTILRSFLPEKTDVVLLGNQSSNHLGISESELEKWEFRTIRTYRFEEKGRWRLAYRPDRDEIVYHSTDRDHAEVIGSIFPVSSDDFGATEKRARSAPTSRAAAAPDPSSRAQSRRAVADRP